MPKDNMPILLVLLVLSPLLIFTVHFTLERVLRPVRPAISAQLVCMISVLAAYAPMYALLRYGARPAVASIPGAIYAFAVYTLAGYTYFHAFNMSETARRIRILHMLHDRDGIPIAELDALYNPGDILSVRVERLIALGQIREAGGRYHLKGRTLLYAAMIIELWGDVLGRSPGNTLR